MALSEDTVCVVWARSLPLSLSNKCSDMLIVNTLPTELRVEMCSALAEAAFGQLSETLVRRREDRSTDDSLLADQGMLLFATNSVIESASVWTGRVVRRLNLVCWVCAAAVDEEVPRSFVKTKSSSLHIPPYSRSKRPKHSHSQSNTTLPNTSKISSSTQTSNHTSPPQGA